MYNKIVKIPKKRKKRNYVYVNSFIYFRHNEDREFLAKNKKIKSWRTTKKNSSKILWFFYCWHLIVSSRISHCDLFLIFFSLLKGNIFMTQFLDEKAFLRQCETRGVISEFMTCVVEPLQRLFVWCNFFVEILADFYGIVRFWTNF